jgi:glyoxylase-like metal-dependent hydrolase (beta-lactamase superfamily II)
MESYGTDFTLELLFSQYGMTVTVPPYRVDELLDPDSAAPLELCGLRFTLYHIPGHSPDSLVFHLPEFELAFSGDTLFAGSIGRTDLPRGGQRMLVEGITRHLLALPPQTKLLPGHGPATTVGAEKQSNPYL